MSELEEKYNKELHNKIKLLEKLSEAHKSEAANWKRRAVERRADYERLLEILAKKEKEIYNIRGLTTEYENILLKILTQCEDMEISFQEVQYNTIFTGEGDNIIKKEYTFSVGQIVQCINAEIWIKPNYDGIHNEGLVGEPIPYKLSTLIDISSVDELIQDKISAMEG